MKKLTLILALALAVTSLPVLETGCSNNPVPTLAPGGAYTDPVRYQLDKVISDADSLALGLLRWYDANESFLVKWPEIATAAESIRKNENGWIKNAYAAEDAYLAAAAAYKTGAATAGEVGSAQAKFTGALLLLNNLNSQLTAYQAAHPHA